MASSDEDVTLYTLRWSPFAQRVHFAMAAKGIAFKRVDVDFANKPAGLLEANPIYGKVPALVHGRSSICESLVILDYLDEAWPETTPLMPKDSVARAKVRFWAHYMYEGFEVIRKMAWMKPNTPEREAAMAEVPKFLKTVEETMTEYSAEGPFFTGDKLGYLDVILLPMACWRQLFEKAQAPLPITDRMPRLKKCIEAIREHSIYTEVIPSDEEMVDFYYRVVRMLNKAAAAAAASGN